MLAGMQVQSISAWAALTKRFNIFKLLAALFRPVLRPRSISGWYFYEALGKCVFRFVAR